MCPAGDGEIHAALREVERLLDEQPRATAALRQRIALLDPAGVRPQV